MHYLTLYATHFFGWWSVFLVMGIVKRPLGSRLFWGASGLGISIVYAAITAAFHYFAWKLLA